MVYSEKTVIRERKSSLAKLKLSSNFCQTKKLRIRRNLMQGNNTGSVFHYTVAPLKTFTLRIMTMYESGACFPLSQMLQ